MLTKVRSVCCQTLLNKRVVSGPGVIVVKSLKESAASDALLSA